MYSTNETQEAELLGDVPSRIKPPSHTHKPVDSVSVDCELPEGKKPPAAVESQVMEVLGGCAGLRDFSARVTAKRLVFPSKKKTNTSLRALQAMLKNASNAGRKKIEEKLANHFPTSLKNCRKKKNCEKERNKGNQLTFRLGMTHMTLRSLKEDNTIKKLSKDLRGDPYSLGTCDNPKLIIDVGANIGAFCINAAKMYPHSQVICAEPAPETYSLLLWNLVENGVPLRQLSSLGVEGKPGVIALHAAIGAEDGKVDLMYTPTRSQNANVGMSRNTSSWVKIKKQVWRKVSVDEYNLTKILTDSSVRSVDLLKMDCEGCEFTVIPSMRDWIINRTRIKTLVGEIHWASMYANDTYSKSELQRFKEVMELRGTPLNENDRTNMTGVGHFP